MNLSELKTGSEGVIVKVKGYGAFRKRIMEMGFVHGKQVRVIKNAPLKDPIEYEVMGYMVSLRRSEASLIEVVVLEESNNLDHWEFNGVKENINIALVGNPNCGKTTLFNYVSGAHEHVGNYGGVTVDAKEGVFKYKGYTFNIVDLPGTYSLSAYSPEEVYVRENIIDEVPDVIVNVVAASNIERSLFLTTQLIDMDVKVVVALNMYDELEKKGDDFDYLKLGEMIGIDFVPTVGTKRKGLNELFDKVIDRYENTNSFEHIVRINYGSILEKAISEIENKLNELQDIPKNISLRFLSIKLLEKDKVFIEKLQKTGLYNQVQGTVEKAIEKAEKLLNEDTESAITDAKYGFIDGALAETYKPAKKQYKETSELIDNVLTHRIWGFPIFFFFLFLMFQSTFTLGQFPMDWIDAGVGFIGDTLNSIMPDGSFKDLLINGIISGVGGVIVFLPNILILFLFISFMEDTGYMARASFIMDKLMHKMGLHGKSFIPLIMGFGCNVPAIMATRTIEDKDNRLITILINPFMSCSARLPIYTLFIGAFFPDYRGLMLFGIYLLGILMAVIFARLFRKTMFKNKDVPFVMELPPYRIPTMRSTLIHMWSKAVQYLRKVGGIILVASIIIWFLQSYPKNINYSQNYDKQLSELQEQKAYINTQNIDSVLKVQMLHTLKTNISTLEESKMREQQINSYIGRLGNFIEPVIRPLGFDWSMGVSILTGLAAKEVVVSTISVLYRNKSLAGDDEEKKLQYSVREAKNSKGGKVFNTTKVISFLIFILLYFPCIGTIAVIKRESGSWGWALFSMFYTTGLAWVSSFVFFQIASLF